MDCRNDLPVSVSTRERAQYKRATLESFKIVSSRSLLLSLTFLGLSLVQSFSPNKTGTEEDAYGYSKGGPPCSVRSKLGEGKSGIDRQESSFRIVGLQGRCSLSAIWPHSITENAQKRSCIVTIRNPKNHAAA